jgi:hypothetical protein
MHHAKLRINSGLLDVSRIVQSLLLLLVFGIFQRGFFILLAAHVNSAGHHGRRHCHPALLHLDSNHNTAPMTCR